jgi:hypothetical protein
MVSPVQQALTHEVLISNLLSTFTLTFTSYRVKFGTFWSLSTTQVLSQQEHQLLVN